MTGESNSTTHDERFVADADTNARWRGACWLGWRSASTNFSTLTLFASRLSGGGGCGRRSSCDGGGGDGRPS